MNECNFIECNSIEATKKYSNGSDQTKFRPNEIDNIEDYFNSEVQKRKLISEKLSKYITACDYFGKILTILSATSGGIPIISFTSVMGVAVRIVSASFSLVFFWLQE